jgi:PadR family transcriptional regulator, regulatory protein PadR
MSRRDGLGGFELQVLLAVLRLGHEAYGVPIADTIEDANGREVPAGSIVKQQDARMGANLERRSIGEHLKVIEPPGVAARSPASAWDS